MKYYALDSKVQHSNEIPLPDPGTLPSEPEASERRMPITSHTTSAGDGHHTKGKWSQRLAGWGSRAAVPLNTMAQKLGSEAFLPRSMEKEIEKAARILKTFCKEGICDESGRAPILNSPAHTGQDKMKADGSTSSNKETTTTRPKKSCVLLTIPSRVMSRAKGLAIFTTGRVGFNVSGSTGSGILIARLPDRSWSRPSGIQIHSLGAGFVIGMDIYDCVIVINSRHALEAFKKTRMSFGSDLAVTAGPWGLGGMVDWNIPESERRKDKGKQVVGAETAAASTSTLAAAVGAPPPTKGHLAPLSASETATEGSASASKATRTPSPFRESLKKPVYSYSKSRGFYAGVQIDGTIVAPRNEANATFYRDNMTVESILSSRPRPNDPAETHVLADILGFITERHAQQEHGHSFESDDELPPATARPEAENPTPASHGAAHPQTYPPPPPPPPPKSPPPAEGSSTNAYDTIYPPADGYGAAPMTSAAAAKAAEAAAERQAASGSSAPPPPPMHYSDSRHEQGRDVEDLPPAYEDSGQAAWFTGGGGNSRL